MPRDHGTSSSQRGWHYQSSQPSRHYHRAFSSHIPPEINQPDQNYHTHRSQPYDGQTPIPWHRGMFPPEMNPPDQSYRIQRSQPYDGCQVPGHSTSLDHDYAARSRAPVLTVRFCPSSGGLRSWGRERFEITSCLSSTRSDYRIIWPLGLTERSKSS
jgi:hypothetical protein